jgi:hypothetical protein
MATSYWAINNGSCKEFALDVLDTMGGETHDTYIVWNGSLMIGASANRPWEGAWDTEFISVKWGIAPPHGLSWSELNQIPFGNHVWVVHRDRHYDAECPEGVDDFFLLPLFRKYIASFLAETQSPEFGSPGADI